MSELLVPDDGRLYPTLGPAICDLMESALVFGPGDLIDQPYRLDEEDRAFVYSLYEVFPRGHELAGRRCYDVAVLMLAKGTKKSERAAAIAAVELHPEAPVRFDGWRGRVPIGRPVANPYIPIVAYTEQQADDTSYQKLYHMLKGGRDADRFDIGLQRITRLTGGGRAEALSSAPDSKDGGLTTFQIKEETHRWTLPKHRETHVTMSANLTKRPIAEPWELHVTTSYRPGEGSLAEQMHDEAVALATKPKDVQRKARFWFFYRWADEKIRIRDKAGEIDEEALERAVAEAVGPTQLAWKEPARIARELVKLEKLEEGYGERVFLNRAVKAGDSAFDAVAWKRNARPETVVPPKTPITLGGDGAKTGDAFAIVATVVATGFQFLLRFEGAVSSSSIWLPADYAAGQSEAMVGDINLAVDEAFSTFRVVRFYVDPPYWGEELAAWRGRYGDKVVLPWETWRPHPMGFAVRSYVSAVAEGQVTNDGDSVFAAHIGAARRRPLTVRDNEGQRLFTLQKEREGSPHKIDAAAAGTLSWQARLDALAAGAGKPVRVVTAEDVDPVLLQS